MNAKDFGIPQNRKRVFMVSILRDGIEPHPSYEFPEPFALELRLKDVLEQNVDEKYYLSDKAIEGFTAHNNNHNAKGTGFIWRPKDISENGGGYANCIRANSALSATDNTIIDNG